MWSHIEQRLDSIAVMKALGGTSGRVLAIYSFQTAYLVLAGSVAGASLTKAAGWSVPPLGRTPFARQQTALRRLVSRGRALGRIARTESRHPSGFWLIVRAVSHQPE
jgi:ABC-type antimicrobial peptide transport system permease subunit